MLVSLFLKVASQLSVLQGAHKMLGFLSSSFHGHCLVCYLGDCFVLWIFLMQ